MLVTEYFTISADRIDRVGLGAGAPGRPLGVASLHHPFAAGVQERA